MPEQTARDPADQALARAYRYVGRRERTTQELRAHLAAHGVPAGLVESTVAILLEDGYLDDSRFARLFVEDKHGLDGWGRDRIARGLRERGLDRELIDEALAGLDGDQELERALELLRRRCPAPLRERGERDRALGILLRKGYDMELALTALRRHGADVDAAELD